MVLDNSPLSWNRNSFPTVVNTSHCKIASFCVSRSVDERERRDERIQPQCRYGGAVEEVR